MYDITKGSRNISLNNFYLYTSSEHLYSSGMSEHEMIESDVLSHMNSTRSDSRLSKRTCPYE